MATFFRNLSNSTSSSPYTNLCTVILNGAVSTRTHASGESDAMESLSTAQHGTSSSSSSPSVFPFVSSKPALGQTFPFYIDLHLFVNCVSREDVMRMVYSRQVGLATTEAEAEAIAGKTRVSDGRCYNIENNHQQHVSILEVLTDRYGPRTGRWGAFAIERGIRLNSIS